MKRAIVVLAAALAPLTGCTVHIHSGAAAAPDTPRVVHVAQPLRYAGACSHRARPALGRCAIVMREGRLVRRCRGWLQ